MSQQFYMRKENKFIHQLTLKCFLSLRSRSPDIVANYFSLKNSDKERSYSDECLLSCSSGADICVCLEDKCDAL